MATKTISIELDVYERLRELKRSPSESFSQVLRRELADDKGLLGSELLRRVIAPGGFLNLSDDDLQAIDAFRHGGREWGTAWKS